MSIAVGYMSETRQSKCTAHGNTLTTPKYLRSHFYFFGSLILLSSSTRRRLYPQRPSGRAMIAGVFASLPRYVPSFVLRIRFSIPTFQLFIFFFSSSGGWGKTFQLLPARRFHRNLFIYFLAFPVNFTQEKNPRSTLPYTSMHSGRLALTK